MRLSCTVHVTGTPVREVDAAIPGIYQIDLVLSRTIDLGQLTREERSELARWTLACFHTHALIHDQRDLCVIAHLPDRSPLWVATHSTTVRFVRSAHFIGKL